MPTTPTGPADVIDCCSRRRPLAARSARRSDQPEIALTDSNLSCWRRFISRGNESPTNGYLLASMLVGQQLARSRVELCQKRRLRRFKVALHNNKSSHISLVRLRLTLLVVCSPSRTYSKSAHIMYSPACQPALSVAHTQVRKRPSKASRKKR